MAGHRPWYTDGTGCTECKTAFEPLFNKYGVDLAVFGECFLSNQRQFQIYLTLPMSGHVHNMQQIAPIANGTVDPAGLNNPKAPWYSTCFDPLAFATGD